MGAAGERGVMFEGEAGPLGLAERYSSWGWWQHIFDLPYSTILKRIWSHISFNVILATGVCAFQTETKSLDAMPVTPLLLCSSALGLLLVFRTTAAYERWQDGQAQTYRLRHHLQQIIRVARPWVDERRFQRLQDQVRAFPRAIDAHLTAKPGAGFLYGVGPRDLMSQLSEEIAVGFSRPDEPIGALNAADRMQNHIEKVLELVNGMEMLAQEAVPRDYSRHTSRFLTVWMGCLPFVLLQYGGAMPVMVAVVSWALLSIEEIGHTLEDPFNSPTQRVRVREVLESGGGEHALASGAAPAPPPPSVLWERRVGEQPPAGGRMLQSVLASLPRLRTRTAEGRGSGSQSDEPVQLTREELEMDPFANADIGVDDAEDWAPPPTGQAGWGNAWQRAQAGSDQTLEQQA